jgi:transcription elongation factor GreB
MSADLMTLEGLEKFRAEYEALINIERPELLKVIAWAASNGDRSENADYQYGKKRLREIDRRLRFLGKRLKEVRPIDLSTLSSTTVQFGATVLLETEDGGIKQVTLVGVDEVDPKRGLISMASPLGRALIGKSIGDVVEFSAPKGEMSYTLVELKFMTLAQLEKL